MLVLLEEQLRLHFGEDYENMLQRSRSFLKAFFRSLLRWGGVPLLNKVVNGEGGRPFLPFRVLLFVVETDDDFSEGVKAFMKYVGKEYVNVQDHLSYETLTVSDLNIGQLKRRRGVEGEPLLGGSPLGGETSSLSFHSRNEHGDANALNDILRTAEEWETLQTVASCGSTAEAARLLGEPYRTVRRTVQRVQARARRRAART